MTGPSVTGRHVAAALAALPAGSGRRLAELAVFAEGAWVERTLVSAVWRTTGRLTSSAADALCAELTELPVVATGSGTVRLEPAAWAHVRQALEAGAFATANDAVLEAAPRPWWQLPPDARYLWRYLPHHLRSAGRTGEAEALAGDLRWVHGAIRTCGVDAAEAALRTIDAPWTAVLASRLAQSAHLLAAAARWDAGEPHGPAQDQVSTERPQRADRRDALGGVLVDRLRGVAGLVPRVERYRATLPPAARLVARWPLPGRFDPDLRRTLAAGNDPHRCVIAPDGGWVAAAGRGIQVWDTATGQVQLDRAETAGPVLASPDGSWLAAADGHDGPLRVWDTRTGTAVATLDGSDGVSGCAVAPDGSWVAVAAGDTTVTIWDGMTWRRTLTLTGAGPSVAAVGRGAGSRLAAGRPGAVTIWDPVTGRRTGVLDHDGTAPVSVVAVAPDGSWLVTGCADDPVRPLEVTSRLWDVSTGTLRAVLARGVPPPRCAAVAPDGSWLGIGGEDGTFGIWDTATWRPRRTLPPGGAGGHAHHVTCCGVAPDGSWLATATATGPVRLWDTATWTVRAALAGSGHVTDLAVAADGSSLAALDSHARTVRMWDVRRLPHRWPAPVAGTEAAGGVTAPDGSWLATAGEHRQELRDPATGALRWSANLAAPVTGWAVAWDGSWLATANGHDASVRIQDAATGDTRLTLAGHAGAVRDCVAAPDGSWLATASDDRTVRVWNPATGALKATLEGHTAPVHVCVVAPDGSWLATAGDDGTVRLWDTRTWRPGHVLTGHAGPIHACVVAGDGSWIGAVDFGDVRFWDIETGETMLNCEGRHISNRRCVVGADGGWVFRIGLHGNQYGPSGDVRRLELCVEDDGFRWFWASEPDRELVAGADAGAVAPDGRWLAITERRGRVTVWNTVTWTCAAATWIDGTVRDCGWLPASYGLWLAGDFGVTVFDFEPPAGHGAAGAPDDG